MTVVLQRTDAHGMDRSYDVYVDGRLIGTVSRGMVTHERGPKGARYVHTRWQSPGWFPGEHRERYRAVIDVILRDAHKRDEPLTAWDVEPAVRAAMVVKTREVTK